MILLPNLYFYLNWIRFIILNFLIIIYLKDVNLFRIITLRLWDSNKFYRNYIENLDNKSEASNHSENENENEQTVKELKIIRNTPMNIQMNKITFKEI